MGIPLTRQLTAFVYAIFTGALLGVLYDCVRVSRVIFSLASYTRSGRKLYAHPLPLIGPVLRMPMSERRGSLQSVLIAVGDVFFAFIAGCVFSVFLYHAASGCFRWFYLFACAVGFFAYYFTLGKAVMLSSEMLSFLLIAAVRYVLFLLMLPFRFLVYLSKRLFRLVSRFILVPILQAGRRRRRISYTRRIRSALAEDIRRLLDVQNS